MAAEKKQIRAVVRGRVQGVYFRQNTLRVAHDIGVTGWVRNVSDGTVEVVAVGEAGQLEKLLVFLRKGPSGAFVAEVEVEWSAPSEIFPDFRVRRFE